MGKYKITKQLREYMKAHPYCEACGRPVFGLPHHIKTRGAGGSDNPENLLSLCAVCHYDIVHGTPGIRGLIEIYPHLKEKVLKIKPYIRSFLCTKNLETG